MNGVRSTFAKLAVAVEREVNSVALPIPTRKEGEEPVTVGSSGEGRQRSSTRFRTTSLRGLTWSLPCGCAQGRASADASLDGAVAKQSKRVRPRVVSVPAGERRSKAFRRSGFVPAGDRKTEVRFVGPAGAKAMREGREQRRQSQKKQKP